MVPFLTCPQWLHCADIGYGNSLLLAAFILAWIVALLVPARWVPSVAPINKWFDKNPRAIWWIVGGLSFIFLAYFITVTVLRFRVHGLPIFDFAIFDQIMWKIAHFQSPESLYMVRPHWLGDHFQPILILLAPFYWIANTPYTLLVLEPLIVASAVIPIVLMTRARTKSSLFALALVITYLAYPGTNYALFFTFHPSTLVAPFLLWAFWAFELEKWIWYAVFMVLALLCKENVGFYIAAFGLWQLIFTKHKIVGLVTTGIGALWSYLAVTVFIPYFRQGPFTSGELTPRLTEGTGSITQTFISEPTRFIDAATDTPWKWHLITMTFVSFGLVPLFFIHFLPISVFLGERLYSADPLRVHWSFHYGAPIVAALVFMSFRAGAWLMKWQPKFATILPLLLILGTIGTYVVQGPPLENFSERLNELQSPQVRTMNEAISLVPPKVSVMAQQQLALHLSHRNRIQALNGGVLEFAPDYVVVDMFASPYPEASDEMVKKNYRLVHESADYGLIYSNGSTAVWQRGAPDKVQLSEELNNFMYGEF